MVTGSSSQRQLSPLSTTLPGNRYEEMIGTSQASAISSGAAALVWSHCLGASAGQVRERLRESAVDLGAIGRDPYFRYGRVDMYSALRRACVSSVTTGRRNNHDGSGVPQWPCRHPKSASSLSQGEGARSGTCQLGRVTTNSCVYQQFMIHQPIEMPHHRSIIENLRCDADCRSVHRKIRTHQRAPTVAEVKIMKAIILAGGYAKRMGQTGGRTAEESAAHRG